MSPWRPRSRWRRRRGSRRGLPRVGAVRPPCRAAPLLAAPPFYGDSPRGGGRLGPVASVVAAPSPAAGGLCCSWRPFLRIPPPPGGLRPALWRRLPQRTAFLASPPAVAPFFLCCSTPHWRWHLPVPAVLLMWRLRYPAALAATTRGRVDGCTRSLRWGGGLSCSHWDRAAVARQGGRVAGGKVGSNGGLETGATAGGVVTASAVQAARN